MTSRSVCRHLAAAPTTTFLRALPLRVIAAWFVTIGALTDSSVVRADEEIATREHVAADLLEAIEASPYGRAYVVVNLSPTEALTAARTTAELRAEVDSLVDPVLERTLGPDFSLVYRYNHAVAFTGWTNRAGLDRLARDPDVIAIGLDQPCRGSLSSSVSHIGADTVQAMGLTGAGITVAVIDSGIDTNHPALAGNIAPGAWHFLDLGADTGPGAEDQHGHGTNVAGIVASNGAGSVAEGVAPAAQILPVRVLDADNSGWMSDVAAGIDYVVSVSGNYTHLAAINISIGSNALYSQCPCDVIGATNQLLQSVANAARLAGMPVFASSGNEGSCNSMTSPACLSAVTAVAALYESNLGNEPNSGTYFDAFGAPFADCSDSGVQADRITCFSNQSGCNELAAPGRAITSTGIGGGTSNFSGTSQASPHCAGVAALLCDRAFSLGLPPPSAAEIVNLLRTNGQPVTDTCAVNPDPIAIDALAAVASIVAQPLFVRGDCNDNGSRNLADVVFFLSTLFGNPAQIANCPEACDANDDGDLDLADAIAQLVALFGNPAVPLVSPSVCGPDPTGDPLTCGSFAGCP